jgi:hypothetical protein
MFIKTRLRAGDIQLACDAIAAYSNAAQWMFIPYFAYVAAMFWATSKGLATGVPKV